MLAGVALTSSLKGAIGSPQDVTAAIVALSAAAIAGRVANPEAEFLTVVAAIILTTVVTGGVYLLIGGLRLGNLVRFMPYPVIGGFLAGTGWLLLKGGIGVASGIGVSLGTLDELAGADALVQWLPAVGFGLALVIATRRIRHPLVIPAAVAGGVLVFYLVSLVTGTAVDQAEADGWLLGPFPEGGLWNFWTVEALTEARWGEVIRELPTLLTVPVLAVVTLLLNTSGIEIAIRRDIDLNRELRSAGTANLAAAVGGGIAGFHALSLTTLAHRAGARTRGTGVVAGAVCLVTLIVGASYLSLFPRIVLAGLVTFLGLSFLVEWVIDAARSLPRSEYLLVLLILATIAAFGFLVGVGIGLAVALVMFVVQYSRTDVVKHETVRRAVPQPGRSRSGGPGAAAPRGATHPRPGAPGVRVLRDRELAGGPDPGTGGRRPTPPVPGGGLPPGHRHRLIGGAELRPHRAARGGGRVHPRAERHRPPGAPAARARGAAGRPGTRPGARRRGSRAPVVRGPAPGGRPPVGRRGGAPDRRAQEHARR